MSRRRISRCRRRHPQVVESNLSWPDSTWPLTSCTHGWIYNFSLYYPTITSQVSYYQLMWIPLASDEPPVVLLFVLLSLPGARDPVTVTVLLFLSLFCARIPLAAIEWIFCCFVLEWLRFLMVYLCNSCLFVWRDLCW